MGENSRSEQFRPIKRQDGYLPIEDYGLLGDGATAALLGLDGSIDWLCIPHFDSEPIFASLLDKNSGGSMWVRPRDDFEAKHHYMEDTGIITTTMRTASGQVEIKDALTLRRGIDLHEGMSPARNELVRLVKVQSGSISLDIGLVPKGGGDFRPKDDGFILDCHQNPKLTIHCFSDFSLPNGRTSQSFREGDEFAIILRWGEHSYFYRPYSAHELIEQTADVWRRWAKDIAYEGPRQDLVRRSAITLKMLDYMQNGAIVAAPTSSLPETIGGERNWDYRFTWVRDAAFTVDALRRIGLNYEASAFLAWVLDDVSCRENSPSLMYTIHGELPPDERIASELEGYRQSKPVRFGNEATQQIQHDVYGEIIDAAFAWSEAYEVKEHLWDVLRPLIDMAADKWDAPGHGIWEKKVGTCNYTYTAAICQIGLDRGAKIAKRFSLPGDIEGWEKTAALIQRAILEKAWNSETKAIAEHLDGGPLDASILTLPLRQVVSAKHPKMIATCEAIAEGLSAGNGLLYRYRHDKSPDGLSGQEGAFLICSFWLVENLALQGRLKEACDLFESLCDRANPLGLLPEQIDPGSGSFLGNFPQAFSHVGLIASAVTIASKLKR